MNKVEKNTKIIPVTNAIREYLNKHEKKDKEIKEMYHKLGFDKDKYNVFRENHNINIKIKGNNNDERREEIVQKKYLFLKNIANKINKNIIWVYQEMVLSGYGHDIDEESLMYKAALRANKDVQEILQTKGENDAIWFEDYNVLIGHLYEDLELKKEKIKVKKRTEEIWIKII